MISRLPVVSATAPFQARITFSQYSLNRNGSPPKLFGGHAPLPSSEVEAGNAVQPTAVGSCACALCVQARNPATITITARDRLATVSNVGISKICPANLFLWLDISISTLSLRRAAPRSLTSQRITRALPQREVGLLPRPGRTRRWQRIRKFLCEEKQDFYGNVAGLVNNSLKVPVPLAT